VRSIATIRNSLRGEQNDHKHKYEEEENSCLYEQQMQHLVFLGSFIIQSGMSPPEALITPAMLNDVMVSQLKTQHIRSQRISVILREKRHSLTLSTSSTRAPWADISIMLLATTGSCRSRC
jgi:hypothetical protein